MVWSIQGLHGSLRVTEWLIKRFVDVEHKNNEGLTPFKICKYAAAPSTVGENDVQVDEEERKNTLALLSKGVYGS
jgi:hypothetical protein